MVSITNKNGTKTKYYHMATASQISPQLIALQDSSEKTFYLIPVDEVKEIYMNHKEDSMPY